MSDGTLHNGCRVMNMVPLPIVNNRDTFIVSEFLDERSELAQKIPRLIYCGGVAESTHEL